MTKHMFTHAPFVALACILGSLTATLADQPEPAKKGTFYTRPPLFSTRPSDTSKLAQAVNRFGPVGIGIELHPPAFVMKVQNVEADSPAAATGQLVAGQIIESINGQTLKDSDPRIQLGQIITDAEASDGKVVFVIKDTEDAEAKKVVVSIPVLGAYSKTWPLDCPKSETIVRNLAAKFKKEGYDGNISLSGPKMLFMLSTGEKEDLDVVKTWIPKIIEKNKEYGVNRLPYAWFIGWGAPPIAEYYLRTGDESVLPLMKLIADAAKKVQYHDAWGGRGLARHHMGIAGTHTLTFLLLAKQGGVDVDEKMLQTALRHFYRFAGRGVNPYPDIRPENTFTDNGRVGALAFAMNAAASLTEDPATSIYAKASDISAIKSFYSMSYMLHGHTGGGIGEVWRSAAMGLMIEKRPEHYREFMNNRTWFYDLSRRYDGSFGIIGGGKGYDKPSWGVAMGLTYTAPRKKLCIFGAPESKYAKKYALPERPWGTAGDDAFYSLEAAPMNGAPPADLSTETVETATGMQIDKKLNNPTISDNDLLYFAHHPEHRFREVAAASIYSHKRFHLIPQLLKSEDPRVRNAGVMAIKAPRFSRGKLIPGFPKDELTPDIQAQLFKLLNDPDEAWFTIDKILAILPLLEPETVEPHIGRILYFFQQNEWWLRETSLKLLAPFAADKTHYKTIIPVMEQVLPACVRGASVAGLIPFAERAKTAEPEVLNAARQLLSKLYLNFQAGSYPGGSHPDVTEEGYLKTVANALAELPVGLDTLYDVSQTRNPKVSLAHQDLYLRQTDPNAFGPKIKESLKTIILEELVPAYVGNNWSELQREARWEPPRRKEQFATGKLGGGSFRDGLSNLYDYAGIKTYNWRTFGPERDVIKWDYFSFEPKEKRVWEGKEPRYRKVTLPDGMNDWFKPEFDPAQHGWKTGLAPFASKDGKLEALGTACTLPYCGCSQTPKTLWENEVLLMRSTITLPPLKKDGYRYRLIIGGRSHVGSGDGLKIFINGQLMHEQTRGVGRRAGAQACGFFIDNNMAPLFEKGGDFHVSVMAFLNHHPRLKGKRGQITLSFDEMKIPPIDNEMRVKSATVIPMTNSDWQALQDPNVIIDENEGKFKYDGTFKPNDEVLGEWTVIGQVSSPEAFSPKAVDPLGKQRPFINAITFNTNGKTDNDSVIWSGDTVMTLDRYQALKMKTMTIEGSHYLLLEAGGFSTKHDAGWTCPWLVLKKK